jgi:hypothetical protein
MRRPLVSRSAPARRARRNDLGVVPQGVVAKAVRPRYFATMALAAEESRREFPWGKVLLGAAGVAVVGGIIYVVLAD